MKSDNCYCNEEYPVVLQFQFSNCSIVCSNCNLNVILEGIPYSIQNDIGIWKEKYKNEYEKWLDTEDNQEELSNTNSLINRLGYDIVKRLNIIRKCYYWWHTYFETMDNCPKCGALLSEYNNDYEGSNKICETCNILLNDTQ